MNDKNNKDSWESSFDEMMDSVKVIDNFKSIQDIVGKKDTDQEQIMNYVWSMIEPELREHLRFFIKNLIAYERTKVVAEAIIRANTDERS